MWWVLKSMYLGPGATTAALNCTTSQPDHLFVAFAPWEPMRHARWKMFRGKDYLCGYDYVWDTPTIVEQQLPGDTDFHLFALTDLTPLTTYWGYMFAPDGHYGREIQGPLFNFTTTEAPVGPEPTPDPINFSVANHMMRTGNRYTFWANQTWYAMVPTLNNLTMWKLIEGVMTRQDQDNRPEPPAGTIRDADARCAHDESFIHVSYFCHVPAPGPDLLRYATFDLSSDSWAIDEEICTPTRGALTNPTTSLALDQDDKPHVVYTQFTHWWPGFDYRHRVPGFWSPPEEAIHIANKIHQYCSLAIDPHTEHVHVIAVMATAEHYYNARPPGLGVWGAALLLSPAHNTPNHSIQAGVEFPHIAQMGQDSKINHWEIINGVLDQQDLTLAVSSRSNVISGGHPAQGVMILYKDDDTNLAYVYQSAAPAWDPPVQLEYSGLIVLTAHFAAPDVVCCLWNRLGVENFRLYAFYAPWH